MLAMEKREQEVKKYVLSLIRHRKNLMHRGVSQKNELLMHNNIAHLTRFMEVYPNTTDIQMALFFLRDMEKIESLLPGSRSKEYDARQSEFLSMGKMCEDLINPVLL